MSIIAGIATAVPKYKSPQTELADFMTAAHAFEGDEARKLRFLYARSGIETRYSCVPDYIGEINSRELFPKTDDLEPFPNLEKRMELFNTHALPLCIESINGALKESGIDKNNITHLITVSCTGLFAPGIDIDLVQQLQLHENINRSSVNFMGCYAAVHALKQADYICKSNPNAIVALVSVELCTLHFQKKDDIDNITSNMIFADGSAAAIVVGDNVAEKENLHGYKLLNFHSQVALNGKKDMAWRLSSTGFLMTLSSYIPDLVKQDIKALFSGVLQKLNLKQNDISHWAIHPGGKKIVENIGAELALNKEDIESPLSILNNYGNMSSATILFVLKHLWENKINPEKPELTFGVAFGPGLTMESLVLQNV
jgi:predicted naringenin-chalcone synthase